MSNDVKKHRDWERLADNVNLFRQNEALGIFTDQRRDKIVQSILQESAESGHGSRFPVLLQSIATRGHDPPNHVALCNVRIERRMQLLLDAIDDLEGTGFLSSDEAGIGRMNIAKMIAQKKGAAFDLLNNRIAVTNSGILKISTKKLNLDFNVRNLIENYIMRKHPELRDIDTDITIAHLTECSAHELLRLKQFSYALLKKTRLALYEHGLHLFGDEAWSPDEPEELDEVFGKQIWE